MAVMRRLHHGRGAVSRPAAAAAIAMRSVVAAAAAAAAGGGGDVRRTQTCRAVASGCLEWRPHRFPYNHSPHVHIHHSLRHITSRITAPPTAAPASTTIPSTARLARTTRPTTSAMPAPADTTSAVAHAEAGESDYYFDSYSHYGIHMEMLKDYHRTTSYRDAIMRNQYLFKDKVVLDVGCGTSILSMFAAKAGAKKVIGVDCSSVAKQAAEIVALNDFGPKPEGSSDTGACEIVILKGKVEELDLPKLAGVTHVDIIISEWMGYFLLYESMLNTVLYARDKWGVREKRLKPGRPAGSTDEADYEEVSAVKLFPDHANMCISAINDPQYVEEKFEVWNDVHGLDFSYFKRLSYFEPLVDTVARNQLRTDIVPLFSFALNTVTEAELSFESEVTLKCHTSDTIHALAVHFDTPFCAGHDTVVLNTSPLMPPTHWRQTVLYLHAPLIVMAGEKIKVGLSCKPNAGNPRDLDIAVKVHFDGKMQLASFAQDFRLR